VHLAPKEKFLMLIGILFDTIRRYLRYRETVSCIAELDEHILRDIGEPRRAFRPGVGPHSGILNSAFPATQKGPRSHRGPLHVSHRTAVSA
jgi:uncharacterized protein YjiS (DUF1127 family)